MLTTDTPTYVYQPFLRTSTRTCDALTNISTYSGEGLLYAGATAVEPLRRVIRTPVLLVYFLPRYTTTLSRSHPKSPEVAMTSAEAELGGGVGMISRGVRPLDTTTTDAELL